MIFTQPLLFSEILFFLNHSTFLNIYRKQDGSYLNQTEFAEISKSNRNIFSYLCSSRGLLLSFDALAETWVISSSSISCFAAIFFSRLGKCINFPKLCAMYLKFSGVFVQLTGGPKLICSISLIRQVKLTDLFNFNFCAKR